MDYRYCLCTEASDHTIKYTITMLYSFLKHNAWFVGDFVIFENNEVPLSTASKNKIRQLYPKIVFRKANENTVSKFSDLFKKKSRFPRELLMRHMVVEAFRLETYDKVLYISSTSVIMGNISDIFSGSADITSTYNTRDFPYTPKIKNFSTKEVLNTSIMVISEHLMNGLVYQSLVDMILSNRTAYDGMQKTSISDYINRNEYDVKFISSNLLVNFSCFPDSNFKKFKRYEKSIRAVEYNIFFNESSPNVRYKKIESYWVNTYHEYLRVSADSPEMEEFYSDLDINELDNINIDKKAANINSFLYKRKRYIDNNVTHMEGVALLKKAIDAEEPFAFTRFGDGDLNIIRSKFNARWIKRGFAKQGLKGSYAENHKKLKKVIIDGMKGSDMIGIMSQKTIRKFGFRPDVWSIPVDDLRRYQIPIEDLVVSDHQLPHSRLCGYIPSFKEIIDGKPIHIISHHSEFLKQNNLDKLLDTEITYTKSPSYFYSNRDKLFEKFPEIEEKIVLFACSGGGKDVGVHLKNNYGKVAIDMGSVIDAWAGVISRIRFNPGKEYNYLVVGKPKYKVAYSLQSPGAREPRDN